MIVNGLTIRKTLFNWISKRLFVHHEPNTYLIKVGFGSSSSRYTAHDLAEITFQGLREWVEKNHGELELVESTYSKTRRAKDSYYMVRVFSPPCEKVIERIINDRANNTGG